MNKKLITLLTILGIFFTFSTTNASFLFDPVEELFYVGGFPLERLRRNLGKTEDYALTKIIYAFNTETKLSEPLIKTEHSIGEYEAGKTGYIAISTENENLESYTYEYELLIYSPDRQTIKVIQNVPVKSEQKFFSWSPHGKKIVYVTGKSLMEGHHPFEPQGVFIYDIEKDKTEKISETGVKVNWSPHDGNIYIQNKFDYVDPADISVYNTRSGTLSKSDRKGILFSYDGKYCFGRVAFKDVDGYPGDKRYLYDNTSNDIVHQFKETIINAKFIDNSHNLLTWGGVASYFKIFDADKKNYIRSTKKYGLIGFNKDMSKVVVYEGGNQIHIDETLTGKRLKTLDLPK